jgi:hypothetical protein
VTRGVLLTALLGASLALGLLTAIVQSHNRGEGARLDALREDCLLLEAVHGAQRAKILELDHGPMPALDPDAPKGATPPAKPGTTAKPAASAKKPAAERGAS